MSLVSKLVRDVKMCRGGYMRRGAVSGGILTLRRVYRDHEGGCPRLAPAIALRRGAASL